MWFCGEKGVCWLLKICNGDWLVWDGEVEKMVMKCELDMQVGMWIWMVGMDNGVCEGV